MSDLVPQSPAVPAPVAPAPVAPVAAPAPAAPEPDSNFGGGSQTLPDGLAARAKAAALGDDPTKIKPAPAVPEQGKPDAKPVAAGSVQDLVGAELMAEPLVATSVSLIEHLCGDKVDLDRAFGKAQEEGDARFIDAAYLKEVLGDNAAAVIQAATQVLAHAQTYGQRQAEAVFASVPGGKETLDKASDFFQANATPQQRAAIQRLLDSGDVEAMKYAANEIVKFASEQGGVVIHNAQPLGVPAAAKGLSRDEYIDALDKGRRFGFKQGEYEKLRAQRALGRQQGI